MSIKRDKINKGLFKEKYLTELRANLVKEFSRDIPDEDWNKVIANVENELREKLESKDTQEAIAKAFWFPLYRMAEKGDVIIEIDGKDLGAEIRSARREQEKKSN